MTSDGLELAFLRYQHLPEQVTSASMESGRTYAAHLISGAARIAPQYKIWESAQSTPVTILTVPSQLPSVELFLLEWMLMHERATSLRLAS